MIIANCVGQWLLDYQNHRHQHLTVFGSLVTLERAQLLDFVKRAQLGLYALRIPAPAEVAPVRASPMRLNPLLQLV